MEEILASIRRIIADDDATKTAKPPEPAPVKPPVASAPMRPAPPPRAPVPPPPRPMPAPAPAAKNNQDDIDAMLADVETSPKAAPPPDVFDLTEAMATQTPPPGPAPSFRTIDGASDVVFTDRPPEPPAEPAVRSTVDEARRQFANATPDRSLLSNTASAAVDGAFNSLAHTVLVQNARTLEDLVKEMLRPMLKAWLDDNLPNMVDRIVRAEIERVSRGR
jgi:cell pole-organizing protein PopZ